LNTLWKQLAYPLAIFTIILTSSMKIDYELYMKIIYI
jgi:hypothetical protein